MKIDSCSNWFEEIHLHLSPRLTQKFWSQIDYCQIFDFTGKNDIQQEILKDDFDMIETAQFFERLGYLWKLVLVTFLELTNSQKLILIRTLVAYSRKANGHNMKDFCLHENLSLGKFISRNIFLKRLKLSLYFYKLISYQLIHTLMFQQDLDALFCERYKLGSV